MVFDDEISVYAAAKSLNILYSTAKAITRKFKAKGHIFKRRREEPDPLILETVVDDASS